MHHASWITGATFFEIAVYNDVPAISFQVVSSGFSCPRIARVISSEEQGTMSKNNFRGITLGRGPIWGIHSLTLIISCFRPFLMGRMSLEIKFVADS